MIVPLLFIDRVRDNIFKSIDEVKVPVIAVHTYQIEDLPGDDGGMITIYAAVVLVDSKDIRFKGKSEL